MRFLSPDNEVGFSFLPDSASVFICGNFTCESAGGGGVWFSRGGGGCNWD